MSYETFEIVITPKGNGDTFSVSARGHRGEQNPDSVEFNAADIVVNPPRKNNSNGSRHVVIASGGVRKNYPLLWTDPPAPEDAREFGGRLFKAVFKDGVGELFVECKSKAEAERANLRIQLDLSRSPQLAVWPWEYLYKPDLDHFFAMFSDTPVVRYLRLPYRQGPLEVEPPLRVLVIVSLPKDVDRLNAASEVSGIRAAVRELSAQGLLALEVLENPDILALNRKLQEASRNDTPFHIVHFIGHGIFDTHEKPKQGKLLFVRKDGKGQVVHGRRIGACLRPFRDNLRLVILNACEGARLSRVDPYAGVAQKILQVGQIPAALAMQFSISDQAAITFAQFFYEGLAHNNALEESLASARLQMQMMDVDKEEWATPVLYMRATDGYILQVQSPPRTSVTTPGVRSSLTSLTGHFQEIESALDTGKLVIFLGLNVNLYGRKLKGNWKPGAVLPSNDELSDYLVRTHRYPLSGVPVARLAQHLVVNRGKTALWSAFASTFNDKVKLPQLYPFLGQVVNRAQQRSQTQPDPLRRRPIILTTNYDKSVERGFNQQGINIYHVISYRLKNEQEGEFEYSSFIGGQQVGETIIEERNREVILEDYNPVIIKLPGAVESGQPLNYVVTEDHFLYLARRDLLKMLPKKIVGALSTARHLYLGYNVEDWPFRALLYSIWGDSKPKQDVWAVIPNAGDSNKPYWRDCHVEVVEAPLETYVTELQHHLFGSGEGGGNEPGDSSR